MQGPRPASLSAGHKWPPHCERKVLFEKLEEASSSNFPTAISVRWTDLPFRIESE